MTEAEKSEFKAQALAVVETVAESCEDGGFGTPEGPLYAALMTQGSTFEMFQSIVGFLVQGGFVKRSGGHVLTITPRGQQAAATMKAMRTIRAPS